MFHPEIYKQFQKLFQNLAKGSTEYFQNGKNSIRIRSIGKPDIIFTFEKDTMWKLETVDSFLDFKRKELDQMK